MPYNRFIQSFTKVPTELFRSNIGPNIRLRAYPSPVRPSRSFDLLTVAEKTRPLALDPSTYEWPNGASMRTNSAMQHRLVRYLKGPTSCIYAIAAGTELPDDLILAHEFRDHYSMQPRKLMTVDELNAKITQFLSTKGQSFTKSEWLKKYPKPTV